MWQRRLFLTKQQKLVKRLIIIKFIFKERHANCIIVNENLSKEKGSAWSARRREVERKFHQLCLPSCYKINQTHLLHQHHHLTTSQSHIHFTLSSLSISRGKLYRSSHTPLSLISGRLPFLIRKFCDSTLIIYRSIYVVDLIQAQPFVDSLCVKIISRSSALRFIHTFAGFDFC